MKAVSAQCHSTKDWEIMIVRILRTNNNTVKSGEFTPSEIMFGRQVKSPFDIISKSYPCANIYDYMEAKKALKERIDTLQQAHLKSKFEKMIEKYNRNKVMPTYEVDDLVWLKRIKISSLSGNALNPKFDGPFKIISIVDKVTAWIIHVHTGTIIRRHFNHLKPVIYNKNDEIIVNQNWDMTFEDILAQNVRRSERIKESREKKI